MQFKDLFHKKYITRFLIFAVAIFLFLPLIFPEKNDFKILNKENVFTHEDSPLPIFPKENLLEKYANKLKKFYRMDTPVFVTQTPDTNGENIIFQEPEEKKTKTNKENENIDVNASDLFFSDDYDDTDADVYNANSDSKTKNEDNSVNLQKGTVVTQDGMILQPTQEGYYYEGKFYKNGTYPRNKDKRRIEGALSRYHSRVAKNLGKKAIYFADENGNLTVSYVNELPNEISTNIDTYLAQNRQKQYYQNGPTKKDIHNNFPENKERNFSNKVIDDSDIALASLKSMHAAYDLLSERIKTGQIGQNIDLSEPFQNAIINTFLNSSNVQPNQIIPNKPDDTPIITPADPEISDTVLAGGQDFAQNYADKINELNCGKDKSQHVALLSSPIQALPAIKDIVTIDNNTISCGIAPLIVEQSASIKDNVSQNSDLEKFTSELNQITNQSEKTDINIISTDRNFYPLASKLNDEEIVRNTNDEPVTVHVIGPSEEDSDLSKVLESVTYSVIDDISAAKQLTEYLSNYYSLTQQENGDVNTILAFPTDNENETFILMDPNNSYWLKNPKQLENMPVQYMEKNGVYYKGVIANKTDIGNLTTAERTNLLYISDQNFVYYLDNGSVLITVKEDDIKINSLHPDQIQKNTQMIKDVTENGQKNLEKAQQKTQQPIEIIDFEKGNKTIQPEK